jgi:hypothetical protein
VCLLLEIDTAPGYCRQIPSFRFSSPVLHTHSMSVCITCLCAFALNPFAPQCFFGSLWVVFYLVFLSQSTLQNSIHSEKLDGCQQSLNYDDACPALPFCLHCMKRDVVLYIERHLLCFACVCFRRLFSYTRRLVTKIASTSCVWFNQRRTTPIQKDVFADSGFPLFLFLGA